MKIEFKRGMRIAPRNHPLVPGSILVVDDYSDGVLSAHSEGGGPCLSFPPAAQRSMGFVPVGDHRPPLRPAKFYFDLDFEEEVVKFEGLDNGYRWNGWATPLLTFGGMEALAEDLDGEYYQLDVHLPVTYANPGGTGFDLSAAVWVFTDRSDLEEPSSTEIPATIIGGEPYWLVDMGLTFDVEPIDPPVQSDPFLELISAARDVINEAEEFAATAHNDEVVAAVKRLGLAIDPNDEVVAAVKRLGLALEFFNHVEV